MTKNKKVFIIAGEVSGDTHAAHLVEEMRKIDPAVEFYGLGGEMMKKAGVRIFHDLTKIAVLGLGDVIKKYFKFRRIFYDALSKIDDLKPELIILVDYPGFNLRFAKKAKERKTKILYYISPQIWAWGKWRIRKIAKNVDKMLLLFDFEKDVYEKSGLDTEFVGHPLIDLVKPQEADDTRNELGIGQNRLIAILPGSRKKEVQRILPTILRSIRIINRALPNARFVLCESSTVSSRVYGRIISEIRNEEKTSSLPRILRIKDRSHDLLKASNFALIASGTTTLEAAICQTPFAILYKVGFSTYLAAKSVVKIPYIGLVNIVAGKKIVPEFIQRKVKPHTIAHEVVFMLNNKKPRQKMVEELEKVKEKLGSPGASRRAAEVAVKFL